MLKAVVMDEVGMTRALHRISFEIIERNKGVEDVVIAGIKRRGVTLAKTISQKIAAVEQTNVEVCEIDITQYRDDKEFDEQKEDNIVIDIDLKNKNVVLIDDVLHTGRTVRAAIDAILSAGRPTTIQLAVLIDRGHRELPIRPDYVGKNVPTSALEQVSVMVSDIDGINQVVIEQPDD